MNKKAAFSLAVLLLSAQFLKAKTQLAHQKNSYKMSKEMQQPQGQQLQIELPEDIAEGIYSNLAIISHSNSEFVVDFIRMLPQVPKCKVKSRIILTPEHAKRLVYALSDNIKKFEAQFGKIADMQDPQYPPMNFNTPKAQA